MHSPIRLLFFAILFLQSVLSFNAQVIDSLNRVLKNAKHDTARLKTLNCLSNEYITLNKHNEAVNCATKALQIADVIFSQYGKDNPVFYIPALKGKITANTSIGNVFANNRDYKGALESFRKALTAAEELGSKQGISNRLDNIGLMYIYLGDNANALRSFSKGLKLKQDLNDRIGMAETYSSFGIIYSNQGDYQNAFQYFFKELKILEEEINNPGLARCLTNIGVIYYKQKNYPKVLEYYLKALKIYKNSNDKNGISINLCNIGVVYSNQGNYAMALEYYFKALPLAEELSNKNLTAMILNNMGIVYEKQNNNIKALEVYFKALKINEEISNKQEISLVLGNLGVLYTKAPTLPSPAGEQQKGFDLAEKYLLRALSLAKEIQSPENSKDSHQQLSELYLARANSAATSLNKKAGYYKLAHEHYKFRTLVNDSLFNERSQKQIAEINTKYETEKKESENKILSHEVELQKYDISLKNYFIYGLVIIIIISAFMSILIIRQNKLKAKQKTIELEQKLLRTQLNPHFIFNSLNAIHNYIYKNDSQNAGDYLSKFSSLMRMILENSRVEFISLDKEINGLSLYLELQALRFDNKFDYAIEIDPKIDAEAIAIPPMLAQPFIENAIEHGLFHKAGKGKITVRFISGNEGLMFEVEDDGIGREKAAELKESRNSGYTSLATTITNERLTILNKGTRKKISLHLIDLKNNDGEAKGTKVVFEIPYIEI